MKQFLILGSCLFSLTSAVFAQEYLVKAGTPLLATFALADIYQYPSFTAGRVLFKDHRLGGSKMNYNIFTGEMEFIEENDTLSLSDRESIITISIGTDVFYYQGAAGYLHRILDVGYAKLAISRTIRVYDRQRDSGYGKTSTHSTGAPPGNVKPMNALDNASAREAVSGVSGPARTAIPNVSRGQILGFVKNEDVIYRKVTDYYIGNAKRVFMRAEKKNLVKVYPEKKASINAYLKENDVDWNNEESLKELLFIITDM